MVKASRNKNHVDLERGVIGGVLKQVKCASDDVADPENPALISVWTCDIRPSQTRDMLKMMSEHITPYDGVSLYHVKRLKKLESGGKQEVVIRTILCSTTFLSTESDIIDFLRAREYAIDESLLNLQQMSIPKNLPPTKELALEWSSTYWPMSWRGNANHQALVTAEFDLGLEREMIAQLLECASRQSSAAKRPVATMIARPTEKEGKPSCEILAVAYDSRPQHPLGHSVMNAIKMIADDELSKRSQSSASVEGSNDTTTSYLCHNLLVYTTHEPCVMCCMALVHSRIGRLIYVRDSPDTGSLASRYQIGDRDGLNWKFDIWKWIGAEEVQSFEAVPGINLESKLNV